MKTMDITKVSGFLREFGRELTDDVIVLTSRRKPVAALVPLNDIDSEIAALSTNPKFLKLIARSREQIRAGRTRTLAQMKDEFGKQRPRRKSA